MRTVYWLKRLQTIAWCATGAGRWQVTSCLRASVRLTSLTSNGTVCSGFGARKVCGRWQPIEEGKRRIKYVCFGGGGEWNGSGQIPACLKTFGTLFDGVFPALSWCASASGAWALFTGLAPVRAHETDKFGVFSTFSIFHYHYFFLLCRFSLRACNKSVFIALFCRCCQCAH